MLYEHQQEMTSAFPTFLTYMQHLVFVSMIDWKCVCMVSGLRVNPENRSGRDSFPSLQREGGRLRT
jgi:hypothetical protein